MLMPLSIFTNKQIVKARIVPWLCGLLFLISGIHKAWSPAEAVLGLEFIGVPRALSEWTVPFVATVELSLGTALFSANLHRNLLVACQVLLVVFTLYLSYLASMVDPPNCGCLGFEPAFRDARHGALFGIFRNFILICGLHITVRCSKL